MDLSDGKVYFGGENFSCRCSVAHSVVCVCGYVCAIFYVVDKWCQQSVATLGDRMWVVTVGVARKS